MTRDLSRVVIIGGGIAGVTSADALRDAGFDGELTIVGAELHRAYSRPALSKAALLDPDDLTSHLLPEPTHGAIEALGVSAARLDPVARRVGLSDGTELPYDGLVIASGSHARRLGERPGNGPDSAELTLRSLGDAAELRRRIAAKPDVIVIGGGPLGMEIASGCVAAGCGVTLVTRRLPQSALLGDHLAGHLVARAAEAGVRLLRADEIAVIDHGDRALVQLRSAGDDATTVLEAPLVVTAVGDEPSTDWLRGSGVATHAGLGLLADRKGRLQPDIVAAGDVAAYPRAGAHRRLPLWTSAIEQAKTAGRALVLGDDAPDLDFQPYFWTEQWGIGIKACGELPLEGPPEVLKGTLTEHSALLRWGDPEAGTATAVAVGMRMPIPRLRALTRPAVA